MPCATIRRRFEQLSLTSRLTAWYVGLLALLLLILGVVLYAGATRLSSAAALGEASVEARNLRDAFLKASVPAQPFAAVAQQVVDARAMQDNLVVITDSDGRTVAQAPGSSGRLDSLSTAALSVLNGPADEWVGVTDGGTLGSLAVSVVRIADPTSGATLGSIQVGTPVAQSDRVVRMFLLAVGIGFGLVLLAAALVGPRLTRVGLQPLRRMAQASRSLANGNLSVRVQRSDVHDEVGELARTF